ncbi:MAG: RagB/SusD family nutrient uptake outer membrane protein [Cytophagales bacterium]|nr:RagB/SusD family nutrient uptake outer membrane protein [Cytophagales bacterium]
MPFASSADLDKALVGAYSLLGGQGLRTLYGGDLQIMAELMGGDLYYEGINTDLSDLFELQTKADNNIVTLNWTFAYNLIATCNAVLENLDVAQAAEKNRIEGEAKALRGIAYFELARYYGQPWGTGTENSDLAVPLVLQGITSAIEADQAKPRRASVGQVYQQVISDLRSAAGLLPASNGPRADKFAAQAFLARVHLQQSNWAVAAAYADSVIAHSGGRFILLNSYRDNFNNRSKTTEDVFIINQNELENSGNADGLASLFTGLPTFGLGNLYLQFVPFIYDLDDQRGSTSYGFELEANGLTLAEASDADIPSIFYTQVDTSRFEFFTVKYANPFAHISVIRLAEMYLTRAEANWMNNSNTGSEPLDDINELRKRAGLDDLDQADLDLDYIKEEWARELGYEGFALHNLKRWKGSISISGSATIPWNSPLLILPIPQREKEVNSNL